MVSWCSLERDLQMLIPGGGKGEKGRKRMKERDEEGGERRREERGKSRASTEARFWRKM